VLAWLAGAALALAVLACMPVVAAAQDPPPPACPDSVLPDLPGDAPPELVELRGLRLDLRSQCSAVHHRLGTIAGALGDPLTVTWNDPPPLTASLLAGDDPYPVTLSGAQPTITAEWSQAEQDATSQLYEVLWVLVGVVLGCTLGSFLYRAFIG
jgi:hypothetical protein